MSWCDMSPPPRQAIHSSPYPKVLFCQPPNSFIELFGKICDFSFALADLLPGPEAVCAAPHAGSAHSPNGPAPTFIRISYNLDNMAMLTEGVRRLGVLLREMTTTAPLDPV